MQEAWAALADDGRRTILDVLRQRDATAGELAATLPIARPGVSRHLRVLREAGLVTVRSSGTHRIYSLSPAPLADINRWLEQYRAIWEQRLDALDTEIKRGQRPAGSHPQEDHHD